MGETTNSKINSKTKPVYFNLDDEDELELYKKACGMNFSKWVKKQLNKNQNNKMAIRDDKNNVEVEKVNIDREIEVQKQNKEIESMMI